MLSSFWQPRIGDGVNKVTLSPGSLASLVCTLEVAAPKPGNVHRGADFQNLCLEDFLVSACLLGQTIDQLRVASVGQTVLTAMEWTRAQVGTNTNLGLALLLVPLAKAIQWHSPTGAANDSWELSPIALQQVLSELTPTDTDCVYQAIRMAHPGGMGTVSDGDLHASTPPPGSLIEAMTLAAERDTIARQFTNQFQDVFGLGVSCLAEGRALFPKLSEAIVFAHLSLMATIPDSLIARKCGLDEARQSQALAKRALDSISRSGAGGEPDWTPVSELDFWLRARGNQRNPGTTADLVAASLFVAIYNRVIQAPFR